MRDIRSLDLNLLKALDALLDERSVTRAAERLGLTQPAVSGMLTRMRVSFDDPLFVRTQRGVVPTLRAMELAGPVKQVLGDVEALLQPPTFDPATAEFTMSIAATDYALHAVVLPFLPKLRAVSSGVRVAVRPLEHDRAQMQFERGDLDLALVTPETAPPDLHARHLFDETYVCAMREGHPDACGPIDLDRFCALDHALVSYSGERFWGVTDDALASLGRRRRVALSVTSFLILAEILRSTDLIAVVPRRLVEGVEGILVKESPVSIPGFSKIAVWHERTHSDPRHRWIRSMIFETLAVT
ncbi:LysR family transcriptional regulator [Rhizobium sp. LEGMi198b]|uniref:LysR family transcriptional regulator n=1 Tax=unclassified Rhizobium TaxID=2613769 RepID=UPI000CF2C279|nr:MULTISPECIES: LysR family transcriptional regulator [Rhizobium]UWU24073.1 LysR family transcriptional regulator [Rhizobium tropici]